MASAERYASPTILERYARLIEDVAAKKVTR